MMQRQYDQQLQQLSVDLASIQAAQDALVSRVADLEQESHSHNVAAALISSAAQIASAGM